MSGILSLALRTRNSIRRRLLWGALLLLCAIPAGAAGLWWMGWRLVRDEPPRQADAIIVLGGDYLGSRITTGCQLLHENLAPKALISGPESLYGRHEDEFAIDWAVARGCPADRLTGVRHHARSTADEADIFGALLRKEGVRRYLLVTSNFHTRRAARVFESRIPDIPVTVIAAPHREYDPGAWWQTRQGRKIFLLEWTKTIADWLGA